MWNLLTLALTCGMPGKPVSFSGPQAHYLKVAMSQSFSDLLLKEGEMVLWKKIPCLSFLEHHGNTISNRSLIHTGSA